MDRTPETAAESRSSAGEPHSSGAPDGGKLRTSLRGGEPRRALAAPEIARRALASTVFIHGDGVYGAGLLIDADGHVLTCNHVVEGLERIDVAFSDGTRFQASRVDHDAELDLALLSIDTDREPALALGSITDMDMGQDVFAMGAPKKMAFSLSRGMVSYVGREFSGVYYMQSDVAINSGSSGGPVMNGRGEVVGLSSFILEASQGMAFAVPIDYARERFARHLPRVAAASGPSRFQAWLEGVRPGEPAPR